MLSSLIICYFSPPNLQHPLTYQEEKVDVTQLPVDPVPFRSAGELVLLVVLQPLQ
jgi:hypothetical protein